MEFHYYEQFIFYRNNCDSRAPYSASIENERKRYIEEVAGIELNHIRTTICIRLMMFVHGGKKEIPQLCMCRVMVWCGALSLSVPKINVHEQN